MEFPSLLIIIGVILFIILIPATILYFITQRQKAEALSAYQRKTELQERQERAVWANATIVNLRSPLRPGHIHESSGRVKVELRLLVTPPAGEPYQAVTSWLIDSYALGQVQPGQEISVKIDVKNRKTIYPNVSWAEYSG